MLKWLQWLKLAPVDARLVCKRCEHGPYVLSHNKWSTIKLLVLSLTTRQQQRTVNQYSVSASQRLQITQYNIPIAFSDLKTSENITVFSFHIFIPHDPAAEPFTHTDPHPPASVLSLKHASSRKYAKHD